MGYEPQAVYGIIGNPVKHSLSPAMHNAAFKALKVDAVYQLFPIADEKELALFMEDVKEEGNPIFGFNVTLPYKEAVVPFMDVLDPLAQKMGAVNTVIVNHQRKLLGFNTDGPGFLSHLTELGVNLDKKRVAILGAGGTTRAILSVLLLLQQRPLQIKMYNRTPSKLKELINELSERMDTSIVSIVDEADDLDLELADMLINTASVGMKEEDPLLIDPKALHANLFVYDVIYAPKETRLLQEAKKHGARIANGLGMLFYQGVLAFQHWADHEVQDKLKKIMRQALEEKAYGK